MSSISPDALAQLFTEGRTFHDWLPRPVEDSTLRAVYDLMKMGPTSANSCPARIVFVQTPAGKEKLLPCVVPQNADAVKRAPGTAIIAMDDKFYDLMPKLIPPAPFYRDLFASNKELAESTKFRNSSLQGAYFILAARALGLDCGPMSGFDNKKMDDTFFAGTAWKSNFICNIGYGDRTKLRPRLPRLAFEEACKVV
jgi:nitroreductase